jgi:hypothetical protein
MISPPVEVGGVSHGEKPLEAVEDQIEPELELVPVVVARLEDVLGRQLGEVRVFLEGNRPRIASAASPTGSGSNGRAAS